MVEGKLYLINKPDPNRPIENKFVTEINGNSNSFMHEDDAMLFLFDNGVRRFKYLTKEDHEYKDVTKLPIYEFWHIKNRIGYVIYDFQPYVDENNKVKRRRAFVWRFVGFGRICYAKTKEELTKKVMSQIDFYSEDPEERGFNIYPFYTRHNRSPITID